MAVSSIILPVSRYVQELECERVGIGREIEKMLVCRYRDIFDTRFIRYITPENSYKRATEDLGRFPHFGINYHLHNFIKHNPKYHERLMIENPYIIAVLEVPNKKSIRKGYKSIDLGIPGGKRDRKDINVIETVDREIKEETCLDVDIDFEHQINLRSKYGIDYPYQLRYIDDKNEYITYIILI